MHQLNQPKKDQKLLDPAKHGLPEFELTSKWLYGGLLVAVVAIASGWFIARNNAVIATDKNGDTPSPLAAVTTTASGEALTVNDQPAGSEVTIAHMTITKTTWVAIRDVTTQWIRGARRFEAGTADGTVYLLHATDAGSAYEAILYVDNGDKAFNFHTDSLVAGIASAFTAK